MRRVLKWFGIVLGSLLVLALLVAAGLYTKSRLAFTRRLDVQVESIAIPTDSAAIERGRHLATILCMECHQDDLGGNPTFMDLGPIGSGSTPNLTSGSGGIGAEFSDADFVRVLRHGVKPDGRSVFIMPAQDLRQLSDQDLASLIAYVRSVPAVDRQTPEPHARLTILGNIMYGAGLFGDLLRAGQIANAGPLPAPPEPGVTKEYGKYLVDINGCRDCHGQQLAGAKPADPESPLAPNLTQGGVLKLFSEQDFINTLRTGVTPSGTQLPARFMPWPYKGKLTDDELKAVWAYLQSIPALPTGYAPAE